MGSVEASGGPLIPFSMVMVDGGITLARYAGELEAAQQHAREQIRGSQDAQRVALAWDGYLTVEGRRSDAVFVEASERGGDRSVVIALRYESVGRFRKHMRPFGDPVMVEYAQPLF